MIEDYLENITDRCVRLLGENQNVEDFISAKITTCELYDAVVGIGNIAVKLYKIEAQREYPIRWADVASNSGGEGFLSAFIILSSLLSFLRRTDSDLFGEREESKVLVMDNPFAQRGASFDSHDGYGQKDQYPAHLPDSTGRRFHLQPL